MLKLDVNRREFLKIAATPGNQERSTTSRLFLTRVQPVEYALQLFQLLPGLAELAFRRQTLVVGKVFGDFRDECVQILSRLGRCGGCIRGQSMDSGIAPSCSYQHFRHQSSKKRYCTVPEEE
jgi:hypothetical protein